MFSDGCGYQNRNSVMSNALSYFATKNNVCIEQKFLEKGHTQMECDSAHALIERKLKRRQITLPSQYVDIIYEARKRPFPFEVVYLSHDFFKNYDDKSVIRFHSIRPGKAKTDPTVNDLRCLRYDSNGKIFFKINFDEEFKELPQRPIKPPLPNDFCLKPLFNGRLPIKQSKWKHLQELKKEISAEVHDFYDNLPFRTETNKDSITQNKTDTTGQKTQKTPTNKKSVKKCVQKKENNTKNKGKAKKSTTSTSKK